VRGFLQGALMFGALAVFGTAVWNVSGPLASLVVTTLAGIAVLFALGVHGGGGDDKDE